MPRSPVSRGRGGRKEYLELAFGVELADFVGDVGELLARGLLAYDPRVGKDAVGIEAFGGVEDEEVLDEVLGHVRDRVPVGRREVKGALLDEFKEVRIIFGKEGLEATQPTVI